MATYDASAADDAPIRDRDGLAEIFRSSEKPRSRWKIGGEAEKFGVDATTAAPMQYDGERGVTRVFESLVATHRWSPVREAEGGPVIALRREDASVTLEPGAQLELSGAPVSEVHDICTEMRSHLAEIADISREMNLAWLGVGFHPFARQADLPWVPKQRYGIMREYLPTKGPRSLDMMRRTATVQANFDYESEEDALRKLQVALKLSPIVHAMLANSPFYEGRLAGKKSVRGETWMGMDPDRSGLIPSLWEPGRKAYRDYVEWASNAGMFFFKRGGRLVRNTGQTFRSFLEDGFEGHRATYGDWRFHVNTLFPEVRLKNTLEVRCCDSLPVSMACALPALFTGILYDPDSLAQAEALTEGLDLGAVEASRPGLVARGLEADLAGRPARELAERVLDLAEAGLERRARLTPGGRDERIHLRQVRYLVERGKSPADLLTEGLTDETRGLREEILGRTRA